LQTLDKTLRIIGLGVIGKQVQRARRDELLNAGGFGSLADSFL